MEILINPQLSEAQKYVLAKSLLPYEGIIKMQDIKGIRNAEEALETLVKLDLVKVGANDLEATENGKTVADKIGIYNIDTDELTSIGEIYAYAKNPMEATEKVKNYSSAQQEKLNKKNSDEDYLDFANENYSNLDNLKLIPLLNIMDKK